MELYNKTIENNITSYVSLEEAKKKIRELLKMIMKEHCPYEYDYSEDDSIG